MADDAGGRLDDDELEQFLALPLLLKLACLRPDGWPYVVPLWYVWQARKLYVIGRERAVWIGYLRRETRVGVLIDEDGQRHRRVQMTATAAVVEGPAPLAGRSERWRQVGESMAQRYMAGDGGRAYANLTAERPRFLVEITPVQLTSWRGGPWHHRYYTAEPAPPPPTAVVNA